MKCDQQGCDRDADYRFTWPGRQPAPICAIHAGVARNLARVMEFDVPFERLDEPGQAAELVRVRFGLFGRQMEFDAEPVDELPLALFDTGPFWRVAVLKASMPLGAKWRTREGALAAVRTWWAALEPPARRFLAGDLAADPSSFVGDPASAFRFDLLHSLADENETNTLTRIEGGRPV